MIILILSNLSVQSLKSGAEKLLKTKNNHIRLKTHAAFILKTTDLKEGELDVKLGELKVDSVRIKFSATLYVL